MKHFIYRHTGSPNVGDAIQSIALSRLLPDPHGVERDDASNRDRNHSDSLLIANGWLGRNRVDVTDRNTVFAGIHVHDNEDNYLWMRNSSRTVGARDPYALMELRRRHIPAELIGCCTLTFEPYTGPRRCVYAVDHSMKGAASLTHLYKAPYAQQWALALDLLHAYRTAEAVYTTRLHVALPCLAFGTPVWLKKPESIDQDAIRRFSILDAIGFPYEKLTTINVDYWREKYLAFLKNHCALAGLRKVRYPRTDDDFFPTQKLAATCVLI